MMLLMMHQPHLHQPWRLDRCSIHSFIQGYTPSGFSKATWDAEMLSYRRAIATIVDQMARNTSLMGDNRRVDICCDHI